jgi:hypothetical protein
LLIEAEVQKNDIQKLGINKMAGIKKENHLVVVFIE